MCSMPAWPKTAGMRPLPITDRKSTRLNSSHTVISYAVFCLKKKKQPSSRGAHQADRTDPSCPPPSSLPPPDDLARKPGVSQQPYPQRIEEREYHCGDQCLV